MLSIQDYDRVAKFHWTARQSDVGNWYASAHVPGSGKRGKSMLMHRLIMDAKPGQIIDHRDGWGLNNSRENLRICSTAENIRNQRPHRDRKHPNRFKGITLMANGKWRAQIMVNYKKKNLGSFSTPEEAARAYDKAALELHGEFACLNFPAQASRHSRGSESR